MISPPALRWILGTSLGLGVVDLLVIDVVLARDVVAAEVARPRVAASQPTPAVAAVPAPRAVEPPPAPVADEAPPVVEPPAARPPRNAGVYFDSMSAVLDHDARRKLDELEVRGMSIVLEGHADERGADTYNKRLSRKRALAVSNYLVARGADRARIHVRGAGEVGAGDPDLWRDRRVDIELTGGPR